MKISFKLKIALISLAVSGTLLAAFGVAFFILAYSSAIERLDNEIRSLVQTPLHSPAPPEFWKNFERSLQLILSGKRSGRIALIVLDSKDQILVQTTNALAQLLLLPRPERPRSNFETRFPYKNYPFFRTEFDVRKTEKTPWSNDWAQKRDFSPPKWKEFPMLETAERFHTLKTESVRWRVGILRNSRITVIIAMDMGAFYAELDHFRNVFIIIVPLALLLMGFAGWFLAGRVMMPVGIIADAADGITARDLGQRIPPVGRDAELQRLVTVVNCMLERLEKSYYQAVRFSADAAHELQTPLTILQGELDNAIQSSANGSVEQQHYSMLLEELSALKSVVQKLLLLAHADEGRLYLNPVLVNLSELIRDAAEDVESMAPELKVHTQIAASVHIPADPALLRQILLNMTSNAVKYTQKNGTVIFLLKKEKMSIRFTLANTAPLIPEADLPLLFRRFHRVDKSRTTAGSGLGLGLALELARAHGGDLALNPYADGMVSFTLSLPVA